MLAGHTEMSRDETRVLSGHRVLAGRMEFPHHKCDLQERRTLPCNQLTPRVLAGHTGMSRDDTRVLSGHRVLADRMEFLHH